MNAPTIVDLRGKLPRNANPSLRFHRRALTDIRGVVVHQILGTMSVEQTARYHASPECHIAPGQGCPGICYVYFVDYDGTIYQCNDREDITWSQGGATIGPNGGQPNTNYLALVVRGDFDGEGYKGTQTPTTAQLAAVSNLWRWLRDDLGLEPETLYGHHDFGKPACPGNVLKALIETLRTEPGELAGRTPTTDEEWQRALVLLGYDLGTTGPAGNGVDGEWGPKSDAALVQFQAKVGIPRKGRDAWTATNLARALIAAGKSSGCLASDAVNTGTPLAAEPPRKRARHGS